MTSEQINSSMQSALVYMPRHPFLLPYFERELQGVQVITDLDEAAGKDLSLAVMISSTDIYDAVSGDMLTEETAVKASCEWADDEARFAEFCQSNSLPVTILRCPEIIGTGMRGLAMRMARGIARGTLMHIRGNESKISLIHAVDVAHYAIDQRLTGRTVNITDGTETSIDQLINALSTRLNDKNVLTIKSALFAKALYGNSYYKQLTQKLTFSNALIANLLGDDFKPNVVTDYLCNHIYDDNSL